MPGLKIFLPYLISLNQSNFVKDRGITKNILVAQKIITNIRKRSKTANTVIKLDMAKAYDRME